MLRRSHTAVLEKNEVFTENFETEPYETGWACEAIWFVRVLEATPGTKLVAHAQVSPDGLFWCDKGDAPLSLEGEGLVHLPLRDFGGWLRLRCELKGERPSAKVLIYLFLKE